MYEHVIAPMNQSEETLIEDSAPQWFQEIKQNSDDLISGFLSCFIVE